MLHWQQIFGEEGEWRDRALCKGLDYSIFFPKRGGTIENARKICAGCAVADDCGAWAVLNYEKAGIWAGMTRRQIKERRRELGLGEG